jgi:DNA invertase Pin-like site-specific DNA recombinase
MAAEKTRRRCCATYTRKSSEEGLEQDFNSLDAQREACEAYIRSQAGEGWKPVKARYDDGGLSGGNLDRPGLQQLLADIEDGKIDTVVVYKVDRLSRSLADFAKIVDVLDAHDVSFVSVTQQFNTTTSMGRLTLNMLLSFAQFEREVTGERIRDKIAASKRKGLWMGGYVPLGYEADGRALKIVESEAETVRTIFRLYLELGNVRLVKEEADRQGLRSKARLGADEKMRGGGSLGRGHIYRLLNSPIYIGYVPHKGERYEGQHPAIVDQETWEAVQKRLAEQAPARTRRGVSERPSALRGKLFDESGAALTPSHAVKGGRRYRYYVSRKSGEGATRRDGAAGGQGWRLPAQEIERIVEGAAMELLRDESELACAARESGIPEARIAPLLAAAGRRKGKAFPLIHRVDLSQEQVVLHVNLSELVDLEAAVVRRAIPIRLRRRGVEMKLVLPGRSGDAGNARIDQTLVKAVVRARDWFDRLASGQVESFAEIARAEGVTGRYVAHVIPLAFLAPDIVASILAGTQPVDLTAQKLIKQIDLPLDWAEQRELLGFAP